MAALLSPTYRQTCLWQAQSEPPKTADGPVPSSADVVVVGAGLCGLSAALTLAGAGRSVVVLDREPLGWGASSRNGGMVIPELKAGPAKLVRKYGELGKELYQEVNEAFDLVEELTTGPGSPGTPHIPCDYVRPGMLLLAHSQRHVAHLRAMAAEHSSLGEDVRFVPREELGAEIGSDDPQAGLVFDRTGLLHPGRFHAGLAAAAISAGARVHDRTAATGIVRDGSWFIVVTTRGPIRGGRVIVATNASADRALPKLQRRVLPIASYIIATEPLSPELARSVNPHGRALTDTKNLLFYWRLTPDGRLAFGGRGSLDPIEVAGARDFLYDAMLHMYPQLAGTAIDHAWGGSVAMTLDRLPHVGSIDGAWYAAGCNGTGVALSTWLGHRLAEMALGEAAPPAFAQLRHRAIPARSLSGSYLPVVSRWFQWQDSR